MRLQLIYQQWPKLARLFQKVVKKEMVDGSFRPWRQSREPNALIL